MSGRWYTRKKIATPSRRSKEVGGYSSENEGKLFSPFEKAVLQDSECEDYKELEGSGLDSMVDNLIDYLTISLWSIEAGNTSIKPRNEAKLILFHLVKKGIISGFDQNKSFRELWRSSSTQVWPRGNRAVANRALMISPRSGQWKAETTRQIMERRYQSVHGEDSDIYRNTFLREGYNIW